MHFPSVAPPIVVDPGPHSYLLLHDESILGPRDGIIVVIVIMSDPHADPIDRLLDQAKAYAKKRIEEPFFEDFKHEFPDADTCQYNMLRRHYLWEAWLIRDARDQACE